MEAGAREWVPTAGEESWLGVPALGGNLRCSLNFLELQVPHLEDWGKKQAALLIFVYDHTHTQL